MCDSQNLPLSHANSSKMHPVSYHRVRRERGVRLFWGFGVPVCLAPSFQNFRPFSLKQEDMMAACVWWGGSLMRKPGRAIWDLMAPNVGRVMLVRHNPAVQTPYSLAAAMSILQTQAKNMKHDPCCPACVGHEAARCGGCLAAGPWPGGMREGWGVEALVHAG